jgi:glycosyltransferase involved in cell wall biosynthesis
MKLGVAINDTWAFMSDVYALFQKEHLTTLFTPRTFNIPVMNGRINRYFYQKDLHSFLKNNNVCFFEWAGEYLTHATMQPKQNGIVTRLHRYELYQWASQVNWDKVDKIILVSNAKKKELEGRFPSTVGKTIVIPEGVNLNNFIFNPQPFRKQLGILGHLSPRKRVYELILAFYEGGFHQMGYTLHVGGGQHPKFPDYYYALTGLVERLGIASNVAFHDHVSDPKNWFAMIDILISNSYSEGLQVSPMEAMSSGVFCLSHHWDGADELLPEKYLFDLPSNLREKILGYADSSEQQKMDERKFQRRMVEQKFNIQKISREILHVVNEVGEQFA